MVDGSLRVPPASSTTKTGRHDIAEILLKVALKHQKSKSNQILIMILLYICYLLLLSESINQILI